MCGVFFSREEVYHLLGREHLDIYIYIDNENI